MQTNQKVLDVARDLEKRERKTKNHKKSKNNKIFFFTFTFLNRKIYTLLENIFGKTLT